MTSDKKKKIVIVIVIVVLVILLLIGAVALVKYISFLKNQDNSGLNVEPNLYLDEDATPNPDMVLAINVSINQIIQVEKNENGKYTMTLGLTNKNEHQYMFSMAVDDVEIYTSDLIPAGASLPEVELDDIDLETGTYDVVLIFNVISEKDNATLLGSTGIQLVLNVTK